MSAASTRSTPGRDELVKALRREGMPVQKLASSAAMSKVAAQLNYADLDTLYAAIGEGHLSAKAVVQRVQRDLRGGEEQLPVTVARPPRAPRTARHGDVGVHVEGLDDVMVRLSRCCTPVPGDEIMGFVTRGRGVSVHRTDCANALSLRTQADRVIDVEWDNDAPGNYVVSVEIEALDRSRLLRDVADVLSEHHVNIIACTSQTQADRIARLRFDFELADPGHLALDPAGGEAGRFGLRSDAGAARRAHLSRGSGRSRARYPDFRPARFRTGAGTPTSTACSGLLGRDSARAEPGSLAMSGGTGSTRTRGSPSSKSSSRRRSCRRVPGRRRPVRGRRPASRATRASASSPRSSRRRRSRRSAARRPTPPRSRPQVVPGQTVTTQTVNGLKFTVTQDDAVGRRRPSTTSACDSGGIGSNAILQVTESVTWPGAGATAPVRSTTALVAAGRRVLRRDRLDRGQGAQRRRAARSSNIAGVDHRARSSQSQTTTAEGCAFFAFLTPGAYTVSVTAGTGVGDQEVLDPESDDVGDGRPDRVADVQLRHRGDDHRSPVGRARPRRRRRTSRSASRTPASSRTASTRTRPGTTTLDAAVPVPERLHGVRRELHRQQPARSRHDAQPVLQQPGHRRPSTVTPGGDRDHDGPALRPRRSPSMNSAASPAVGATLTATETTGLTRAAVHAGVHERRRRRAAAPTLGLVTTGAAGIEH